MENPYDKKQKHFKFVILISLDFECKSCFGHGNYILKFYNWYVWDEMNMKIDQHSIKAVTLSVRQVYPSLEYFTSLILGL